MTKVEICFYKPTGFADTHWVDTNDRGLAVRTVMALYEANMLKYLNYIQADIRSLPKSPNRPPEKVLTVA